MSDSFVKWDKTMLSALILSTVVASATPVQEDPYAAYKKDLPKVGTKAPNFKVKDDNGKDFELYKSLKDKKVKATVLNFWFDT